MKKSSRGRSYIFGSCRRHSPTRCSAPPSSAHLQDTGCQSAWRRASLWGWGGVDGELITLEAPLRFSVDPGALRVFVPEGSAKVGRCPPLAAGWHATRTLRRWLCPTPAP